MVGVSGRSRGCLTCRARKKGCDQQRPKCGQCQRSNLVCRGYQNSLTFVMYQSESRGSSRPSPETQAVARVRHSPTPTTLGSYSLNHTAFESQLIYTYWDLVFPRTVVAASHSFDESTNRYACLWQNAVKNQALDDKLVRTGLLAVAYSQMARESEDKRTAFVAMEAYSQALKEVNFSLQHAERQKSDSLLACCKLLAMYEAWGGSGTGSIGVNWENHTLGVNRLVLLRGPTSYSTHLGHTLFLDSRYQAMIVAFRRREPCVFASPEWMTAPWANRTKESKDELLDLMVQAPGICAEFDSIKSMDESCADTLARRRNFFLQSKAFQGQIHAWLERFKESTGSELMNLIEEGIPEDFSLKHNALAWTLTLYWALCALFYNTVSLAYDEFPAADHSIDPEKTLHDFDAYPHALKIAKSVKYFFQECGGKSLAQSFSFPMGVALIHLSSKGMESTEFKMLVQGFQQGSTGKMISRFLSSFRLHDESERGENGFQKYLTKVSREKEIFRTRFAGFDEVKNC